MTAAALIKPVKLVELRQMQAQYLRGENSWIYFFWERQGDRYKIGKTNNPYRRCQELSSLTGLKLEPVFEFQAPDRAEKIIHRMLKPQKSSHEWFKNSPEVDQMIEVFEECRGVDDILLTAEEVDIVLTDWANSYGRGANSPEGKETGNG